LYKKWEKRKKRAYDVKLPVSIHELENGIPEGQYKNFDMIKASEALHRKMRTILKGNELLIYEFLFVQGKNEIETAELLGYKTSEKNRKIGYKTLKNSKKSIISKVKKCLYSGQIDI
jgi:DNA-directed RNA polymerase specialized sigma subunit